MTSHMTADDVVLRLAQSEREVSILQRRPFDAASLVLPLLAAEAVLLPRASRAQEISGSAPFLDWSYLGLTPTVLSNDYATDIDRSSRLLILVEARLSPNVFALENFSALGGGVPCCPGQAPHGGRTAVVVFFNVRRPSCGQRGTVSAGFTVLSAGNTCYTPPHEDGHLDS